MSKVSCSKCGRELGQDSWNPQLFLLFCEDPSCILFKRPQAKRYKDRSGNPSDPPKASQWLLSSGVSLVERNNKYVWIPTRFLRRTE
jgi:hypothetical protein